MSLVFGEESTGQLQKNKNKNKTKYISFVDI